VTIKEHDWGTDDVVGMASRNRLFTSTRKNEDFDSIIVIKISKRG